MRRSVGCLMGLGWLALMVMQVFAVAAGLQYWLGWNSLACWLLALVFGWWPLVGTAFGMAGAHFAWGWTWFLSVMLFWGFAIAFFTLTILIGGVAVLLGAFIRRPYDVASEARTRASRVRLSVRTKDPL